MVLPLVASLPQHQPQKNAFTFSCMLRRANPCLAGNKMSRVVTHVIFLEHSTCVLLRGPRAMPRDYLLNSFPMHQSLPLPNFHLINWKSDFRVMLQSIWFRFEILVAVTISYSFFFFLQFIWSKQPRSEPRRSHSLHVTRVELLDFSHLLYLYKPQRQKPLHSCSSVHPVHP